MSAAAKPAQFEVGGERYDVSFSVNALCALEDKFGGRPIAAIGEEIAAGLAGASGVRALFATGLADSRPGITEREAGRLLTEIGAEKGAEILQTAFEAVRAGLGEDPGELPNADPRGRLSLEAAGMRIMLVFGMNAQAEIEDYFRGLQPPEIAAKLDAGASLNDLRAMFRAALIDDRDLTLLEAGEMMQRIGVRLSGAATVKAFHASFPAAAPPDPEAEPGARKRGKPHPTTRSPKAGTGKR